MKRLIAFALLLNASLLVLAVHQLVAIAGEEPEAELNGDTNGDGERDISDATYYLRWLFQGGPEPVEIVCPVDLGDRVAELEAQLVAANAENASQAEQMTALQGQLDGANAENVPRQDSCRHCRGSWQRRMQRMLPRPAN